MMIQENLDELELDLLGLSIENQFINEFSENTKLATLNNCFNIEDVVLFKLISDEAYYIKKDHLIKWFLSLNIKLAKQDLFRISAQHLTNQLNLLAKVVRLKDFPREFITFGHRYGLIGYDYDDSYFLFPIAILLSLLKDNQKIALEVLRNICYTNLSEEFLKDAISKSVSYGFSLHKPEIIEIVKQREGLLTGSKVNLRQLGKEANYSPEGIRRKEMKFWDQLNQFPEKHLAPFLESLILLIINRAGTLIQYMKCENYALFKFLCKCAKIKYIDASNIELLVISPIQNDIKNLFSNKNYIKLDFNENVSEVREFFNKNISFEDLIDISKKIHHFRREKIKTTQRIYIVLKKLNKPAHYSKITEMHNLVFPECTSSENNIHSYLAKEEFGVVYTGIKGTYALSELGFKRPKLKLFDQAEFIVKDIFYKTSMPVSFNTICAEMGKYRSIVNVESLRSVIYLNPNLKRVETSKFIPQDPDQIEESIKFAVNIENAFSHYISDSATKNECNSDDILFRAVIRCEKCKNIESIISIKNKIVLLTCTSCSFEREYPSGVWGVHSNISCPKCKNDFVIGFHPKYGPYLKCKKCGFWDKISKYIKKMNNNMQ